MYSSMRKLRTHMQQLPVTKLSLSRALSLSSLSGESMDKNAQIGSAVAILGVLLYAVAEDNGKVPCNIGDAVCLKDDEKKTGSVTNILWFHTAPPKIIVTWDADKTKTEECGKEKLKTLSKDKHH
jgi:hypothetical protein